MKEGFSRTSTSKSSDSNSPKRNNVWSPTKRNAPVPFLNHTLALGIDVNEDELVLPEITVIRSAGGDMRLYSCAGKTFISRANADSWRRSESMMLAEAAARASTARRIAIATASANLDVSSESPRSPKSPPTSPYRLLSAFEKSHPPRKVVTTQALQSPTVNEAVRHARGVLDESKLLDERSHVNEKVSELEKEVADLQAALEERKKSLAEMKASISLKDSALEKSRERELALRQELASLTMRFAAVSSLGVLRGGGGGGASPMSPLKSTPTVAAPVIVPATESQLVDSQSLSTVEKGEASLEGKEEGEIPSSTPVSSEINESTPKKASGRWSKIAKLAGSSPTVLSKAATEVVSAAEVEAAIAAAPASPRFTGGGLLKAGMPSSSNSPVLAMLAMASLRAKKIEETT